MKILYFSELGTNLREEMSGARWLLMSSRELQSATGALMFAELDGTLIGVEHKGSNFESGVHNRAIHLLLVDDSTGITGITKVVTEGTLEEHIW